jgi:DNA (cytosine-5)-methyltransferase 1
MAHRVDRLKAIGNGQVPTVAATAFRILKEK